MTQEEPDQDRPATAAVEEPEDVEPRRRTERDHAGRLIDEGPVDREKDQVSEEVAGRSRSAEEEAVRIEDAPGGAEGQEPDRYVEEP